MKRLLEILQLEVQEPTLYGWFHLMWFGILIVLGIILIKKYRNVEEKTYRKIVFITWLIMLFFELYKQFVFSYEFENSKLIWEYDFVGFPYQFCSTPLYLFPFLAFLKNSKARDGLIVYTSTFSLFAGIAVMFYPDTVFVETLGINIQTMVHHGLQVLIGLYTLIYYKDRFNLKSFFYASLVFIVMISVAIIGNEIGEAILNALNMDVTFNLFYISRHGECVIVILSTIQQHVPYLIFLLIYFFGFTLIAYVFYVIEKMIINKCKRVVKQGI